MLKFVAVAVLIAAPLAGASAQDRAGSQAASGQSVQRVRDVTLAQGQACPKAAAGEVVVCHTLTDPYRIPKQFRDAGPTAANNSWVNRAATIDEVSRKASGLPNTCSAVGTGGQTGCTQQEISNWYAEKRQQAAEGTGGGGE